MRIPRDTGAAEPGKYRTARTPYAREPMRCLSPAHPCKRVITMVASQLMKTQIALNWIGALIHMSPSNILTLLPSLALAKRVSARIGKTINVTPELKSRVAASRSRDARNTMDTKEFEGGTLYATTAGSASNLAELAAKYIYGDEIDRWDVDVDEEGDPIELAETRGSTFGRNAKFYFSSSPTIKGPLASPICSRPATSGTTTCPVQPAVICRCWSGSACCTPPTFRPSTTSAPRPIAMC